MPTVSPEEDDLLAVVSDRWGRMVVLTQSRLDHVQEHHQEVSERDIKIAIRDADTRRESPRRRGPVV
jgi:hypothetical protein